MKIRVTKAGLLGRRVRRTAAIVAVVVTVAAVGGLEKPRASWSS